MGVGFRGGGVLHRAIQQPHARFPRSCLSRLPEPRAEHRVRPDEPSHVRRQRRQRSPRHRSVGLRIVREGETTRG